MTFKEQMRLMTKQQKKEQDWSAKQAKKARDFEAKQAQKQMQFQREMSDTAHQREMADLKAAGLNPVLTASGGSGASAPSGAMASAESAQASSILNALPQMLALAETSVKTAGHSAKYVKQASQSANQTANEAIQNDNDLMPIESESGKKYDMAFMNAVDDTIGDFVLINDNHGNDITVSDALAIADASYQDLQNLGVPQKVAQSLSEVGKAVSKWSDEYEDHMRNLPARRQQKMFEKAYSDLKRMFPDDARKELVQYGKYTPYKNLNRKIQDLERKRYYGHRSRI